MVVNISFQKQENRNLPSIISITRYCYLHGKQLTYHDPICCVRIIYHNISLEKNQEIVEFAENKPAFSRQNLAYLRSESWMNDFPHLFEVKEYQLAELPNYYCYVCVIGYKNNKPEYIQIIAKEAVCQNLRNHFEYSAKTLNQYLEIYSENFHQKSKIKLLEHILHKAGHQLRQSLSLIGIYAHNLHLQLSDIHYRRQAKIINENVNKLDSSLTEMLSCGQGVRLNITPQNLKERDSSSNC